MDSTYLAERIERTKLQIEALEDAVIAVSTDAIESYTLDTGQSRQTVTKSNIDVLNKVLDSLYNRLTIFQNRLNGTGTVIGVPRW